VRFGRNSYRNLVSCCLECNTRKSDRPAPDFLRTLYRLGRLTASDLDGRLRALKDLAAGKLRPVLPSVGSQRYEIRPCRTSSINLSQSSSRGSWPK
jgi:hypothetical protein